MNHYVVSQKKAQLLIPWSLFYCLLSKANLHLITFYIDCETHDTQYVSSPYAWRPALYAVVPGCLVPTSDTFFRPTPATIVSKRTGGEVARSFFRMMHFPQKFASAHLSQTMSELTRDRASLSVDS